MNEDLIQLAYRFIEQPFPLWENELTTALVENKWNELNQKGLSNRDLYSTAFAITFENRMPVVKLPISKSTENETVFLEFPQLDLSDFYEEHGLVLCNEEELIASNALEKLKAAMAIFESIPDLHACISKLVRSIQVLKQDDPEIDTSYSHPKIPFSIFVSVCHDNSPLSALRLAESIMHEAMHLKLTLLENVIPLIEADSKATFYSPWRDEDRPIRGVLHGLFVFRGIGDFYKALGHFSNSDINPGFLKNRIDQINQEIKKIEDFHRCPGLTQEAANLLINLSPLN